MVVPEIDVHRVGPLCLIAPEFLRRKSHGIDMLRFVSAGKDMYIRKGEHPVVPSDRTLAPTRVPRKACVARRVNVARPNRLSHLKSGHCGYVA